jgi:hypothetical protein
MNPKVIGALSAIIIVGLVVIRIFVGSGHDPVEVQSVSLSVVEARIGEARTQGSPALLYLYSSSDEACKETMRKLNQVAHRWGEEVQFVVVSVDEDPLELEALLTETGAAFEPLNAAAATKEKIKEMVTALGATYPDVIPYGVVFDRTGAATREWSGQRSLMAWEGSIEEVL